MKTWLVAHRGAQNNARENTLQAFSDARKFDVGYIEFDVRVTLDNIAVIHHDPLVAGVSIVDHSYAELLKFDPELAQFEEVIAQNGAQALIIELKGAGAARHVQPYLQKLPDSFATSFYVDELRALQEHGISPHRMFLAQYKHPIGLVKKATDAGFGGITLNKWYLNPLLYRRAQKHNLTIFIYTVNNRLWAKCIRRWYPAVLIATDRPDKLTSLS